MNHEISLEVIEGYEILGEKRFRLRVKDLNLVVNVQAENEKEAIEKAVKLLERTGVLEELKSILRREKE